MVVNPEISPYDSFDFRPELEVIESQVESLEDLFELDLKGHELVDPEHTVGTVIEYVEEPSVTPEGIDLPSNIRVTTKFVIDPFVDADPKGYKIMKNWISAIQDRMTVDGMTLAQRFKRNESLAPIPGNPYHQAWVGSPNHRAVKLWHSKVPFAESLNDFYLMQGENVVNRSGEAEPLTPEALLILRMGDHPVGIRDRATALTDTALRHAAELAGQKKELHWLSLASGTAKPSMDAAQCIMDNLPGSWVNLICADWDEKAREFTTQQAEKSNFSGSYNVADVNIRSKSERTGLPSIVREGGYDFIDSIGYFEYIDDDGDLFKIEKPAYGTAQERVRKNRLAKASDFAGYVYENLLADNGMFMFGNVNVYHEQLDYAMGVVAWPMLQARMESQLAGILDRSGILDDPRADVELCRIRNAQTGVYMTTLVSIVKRAL